MARKKARTRSPSGTGNITQRGPCQWLARIRLPDGSRPTRTFESKAAAQAWLDAIIVANKKPDRVQRTIEARALTLAQALRLRIGIKPQKNQDWLIDCTERLICRFPELVSKPIYEIDEIDIDDFITERQEDEVSGSTINKDLGLISMAFNVARTKLGCVGLLNPIGPGTRVKENKGRVRRLSDAEEAALMAEASRYEANSIVPIRLIITVAIETAMRFSEIAGMSWEHTDLAQGTIHLADTKNGSPRNVPLWPSVRGLLRDLGPKESGPIWPSRAAIRSAWRRVRAAAINTAQQAGNEALAESLADLRFHDLRHEGTSRLIEKTGWSDAQIMACTGHKTSAMLARYSHLRANKLAGAMVALEGGETGLRLVPPRHHEDGELLPENYRKRQIWKAVSNDKAVLSALVSSQPLSAVAADFGISDVAVHKACARLGIAKPVRGFWLRKSAA